ncbi:UV excision repair protein rad23 [Coemansia spiralis]|uniref:UV excision repair protein RAD23 n=2 Tax=Coemansia TaxID=4863 RepID=A0A9W8KU55_9FUNG|nr:hypothetical protein BX070DRAFT_227792 [Coemansia spiralis]KAJ1987178.1 UV excision repair protein rad23 [Coemansia umbellata]KAJ2619071.1 UV excision repair protein rad23 [Coemansia sp. RSA 1358]KAJ2669913.1 UV excision repair protein rad23 [Coemansia spiralis]
MKLTLKTLQQKSFQVEVDGGDTIQQVKQKVEESQGYPVETQKLIYLGKILTDEKTVDEVQISEKEFMVVMTVKPKAKPKAEPKAESKAEPKAEGTPASQAQTSQPAAPAAQRTGVAASTVPETPTPVRTAQPQEEAQDSNNGQSFLSGDQYETAISNMVEMGYSREQCVKAMRASFNNPDRAVEYLISGIPEAALEMDDGRSGSAQGEAQTQQSTQQPQQTAARARNLFEQAEQQAGGQQQQQSNLSGRINLEVLRQSPQFRQLQMLVRENPQMLPQVLAQIARQQPQLVELIRENEEEFLRMLMEGVYSEEELAGMMHEEQGHEQEQDGVQYIRVTQEEKAAIERLEALGFQHAVVVQAYFACDKNEELTANYLLEHGDEDMDLE